MRGQIAGLAVAVFLSGPGFAGTAESLTAVTVPAVTVSPAERRAEQLDALFARLHRETNTDAAKATEQSIWVLWMASDSPTAEVLLQQATKAMNDGAFDPSLKILNRLIGAYPDFAEAWNKRATLYFAMGRYDDSLADIDKVLDLEPRHFGALSGRGMIFEKQKNFGAAIDAFREALGIDPNLAGAKAAVEELEKIERPI
ncbi:MAG: tetratricopeptide repeat protein [Rhizobiales bacterium]|nr:tetratricopeptide repeat protein [Hyphomicrobiales bacterium]MBI3673446.1 tetratricopeptide repeat protein [Hyphomicrobiales bacterium]